MYLYIVDLSNWTPCKKSQIKTLLLNCLNMEYEFYICLSFVDMLKWWGSNMAEWTSCRNRERKGKQQYWRS